MCGVGLGVQRKYHCLVCQVGLGTEGIIPSRHYFLDLKIKMLRRLWEGSILAQVSSIIDKRFLRSSWASQHDFGTTQHSYAFFAG